MAPANACIDFSNILIETRELALRRMQTHADLDI